MLSLTGYGDSYERLSSPPLLVPTELSTIDPSHSFEHAARSGRAETRLHVTCCRAFFHERTTAQARKTMGAGFLHLFLFLGFSVFHLSSRDEITAFAELQQVRAGCAILPTVGTVYLWIANRALGRTAAIRREVQPQDCADARYGHALVRVLLAQGQ